MVRLTTQDDAFSEWHEFDQGISLDGTLQRHRTVAMGFLVLTKPGCFAYLVMVDL